MKDLILIGSILAMFVFCYFVMKRVDEFLEESRRLIEREQLSRKQLIQIAAETPALLGAVAQALEYCSGADSGIEFAVSSGRAGKLLKRLADGTVDVVLLSEDTAAEQGGDFERIAVPYSFGAVTSEAIGLPVAASDEESRVYVLWNRAVSSRIRDWVILTLRTQTVSAGRQ